MKIKIFTHNKRELDISLKEIGSYACEDSNTKLFKNSLVYKSIVVLQKIDIPDLQVNVFLHILDEQVSCLSYSKIEIKYENEVIFTMDKYLEFVYRIGCNSDEEWANYYIDVIRRDLVSLERDRNELDKKIEKRKKSYEAILKTPN